MMIGDTVRVKSNDNKFFGSTVKKTPYYSWGLIDFIGSFHGADDYTYMGEYDIYSIRIKETQAIGLKYIAMTSGETVSPSNKKLVLIEKRDIGMTIK